MAQTHSLGNILRVVSLDFANTSNIPDTNIDDNGNFVDEEGFFIRAEVEGYLTYCPMNNKSDAEAITKFFDSSHLFIDPELCRKIFMVTDLPEVSPEAVAASGIYIGYGM
jgi:hypothetical protein